MQFSKLKEFIGGQFGFTRSKICQKSGVGTSALEIQNFRHIYFLSLVKSLEFSYLFQLGKEVDCEKIAKKKNFSFLHNDNVLEEACKQKPSISAEGRIIRWYFDGSGCHSFNWNPDRNTTANNFTTKQHCESYCQK